MTLEADYGQLAARTALGDFIESSWLALALDPQPPIAWPNLGIVDPSTLEIFKKPEDHAVAQTAGYVLVHIIFGDDIKLGVETRKVGTEYQQIGQVSFVCFVPQGDSDKLAHSYAERFLQLFKQPGRIDGKIRCTRFATQAGAEGGDFYGVPGTVSFDYHYALRTAA